MGKKAKRRLSLVLAALLISVTCLGNTAFAGIFERTVRKIDVWDFGGVEESNTELYNNNITLAGMQATGAVGNGGLFVGGTVTFGDLTLAHNAKDRWYSAAEGSYGTGGLSKTAYDDGYTGNGMYYANGTGGDNRRNSTIANVQAGDKFIVYMGSSNSAEGILHFTYMGEGATQDVTASFTNKGARYEFVAQHSGTYKIWTDASAGKPCYNRIVRIPGVTVSGTIHLGDTTAAGYKVIFASDVTGYETEAVLDGNKFSVVIAAGEQYTAALTGATGFGFTNDTKKVTTEIVEVLTGKSDVTLKVEVKSTYTYSGKLTGFAADYDISKLKVTLMVPEDSLADDVVVPIAADGSFSVILEPDVEYTAVLEGVNDYEIVEGKTVVDNQNHQSDIKVATKAVYGVSGGFLGLADGVTVKDITFTNVDDNYVYAGTVTADGYTGTLRDGAYAVSATVDGYKTSTHVVVAGGEVKKDILFVSTAAAPSKELVKDIYVGYEDKGDLNYATVKEAVAACKAMNPQSEADRITVHIAPGVYREQIIIETPYISFVNDSDEEVLLTWYYGIGYKYYSADGTGYYNTESAYDKYEKKTVSKWGCSTYLKSGATGFKAEGITFEASFNRYITDEELEDGVEVSGGEAITLERKYGVDVTSKTATERASAMAVEANNVEFVNCSFLGSQDTLYTGAVNIYFKNCLIEGNTDYIFGDGDVVFDGCELSWYGYSTGGVGGYITAQRPSTENGYIFRNCTITANPDLPVVAGHFGRPWGAGAKVMFINTKVEGDLIVDAGWTDMSNNKATESNYVEYNTVKTDGTKVDTSKRVIGVVDASAVANVNDNVKAFMTKIESKYYVEEDATVAFATVPYVVDNGDINAPYPGHTLSVGYSLGTANDANDASVIRWYIVDGSTETLVKSSTANSDVTYKITEDAIGKQIKVVVVPETVGGKTAEAKSYTVEATVRDGYEDPSGDASDITLGDGVNIFLAGDSTVKDYSANGMYMSGKPQVEGSWGEFLQTFFDESKVKIQNYANGGRSTRNFINEGSLDKIKENIKEGDYLFIQFGHNDCANGSGYLEDRYVPLGTPDANGIFPTTAGTKVATPSSLTGKYGDTFYSYDCGGTFKWYLLQYIEVAKQAGATPVLVTPVARLYYTADGTIRTHHDSTDTTTGTYVSSNNAYVTAYKQLAEEQGVLLIDAFELTKTMYEEAYKADSSASNGKSTIGSQAMCPGDSTHSSKIGGFLSAGLIAQTIQNLDLNISKVVDVPSQVAGTLPDGQQPFTVNGKGQLTAYAADSNGNYVVSADYWQSYGQNLIDEIGKKNEELNASTPDEPSTPETPSQPETEAPTNPETPSQPETEAPTNPETPSQPETEAPTNPETPSQPETEAPTNPETPSQPSTEAPTAPAKDDVTVDGADKEVVKDAVLSDDVKFEGDVKAEDVKLVIEEAVQSVITTVKAALETVLEAIDVKVDDVDAKYYDISLKAGDNVVKLETGKVQITFAWEEGKSADKNDVKVYHYNNDKLEEVKATVTADGIKIEADDFSPYVVVYSAKTADAPGTGDTAPVMFYIALCAMMLAAGVVVCNKKRA